MKKWSMYQEMSALCWVVGSQESVSFPEKKNPNKERSPSTFTIDSMLFLILRK